MTPHLRDHGHTPNPTPLHNTILAWLDHEDHHMYTLTHRSLNTLQIEITGGISVVGDRERHIVWLANGNRC